MATPIKRGDDTPQLQKKTWSFEWSRGLSYSEEWKGINPDKMVAKWNGLVYTAQRGTMSVDKGVAELRLEWSGDSAFGGSGDSSSLEVTVDRWECPEPVIEKPVFAHPWFIDGIYSLLTFTSQPTTDDNVSKIIAAFQSQTAIYADFSLVIAKVNAFAGASSWSSFAAAYPAVASFMVRIFNLNLRGQTHYQDSTYACRHTTNAPAYWTRNVSDDNVNCILSPAQFMSEVTDGTLWYFPLPGRLQYKLAAAVSTLTAATPARYNYLIGWLKSPSGESTVGRGRVEISTTYKLDQWSTDLYDIV